jgi:2-keto-4-pentenoate hydratase/2-oxohepta-3-ene-1,7-dioic acid hydratase in catechol pathway
VTEDIAHPDAMLWSVPHILRSALDPAGPLTFGGGDRRLEAGDVIALGTPAGIVLTVADRHLYRILDSFLFWWNAIDWHNAFFGKDQNLYLREGDRVFMWAEGLGCQMFTVRSVPHAPIEPAPGAGAEKPGR